MVFAATSTTFQCRYFNRYFNTFISNLTNLFGLAYCSVLKPIRTNSFCVGYSHGKKCAKPDRGHNSNFSFKLTLITPYAGASIRAHRIPLP